jgi:uncharacterized repeat protein (TIGR02543 family)
LSGLSALANLTSLDLEGPGINGDLSGLSALTNLQDLRLYLPGNNGISGGLSDLSALTNLQGLSLTGSYISGELSELSTLTNLTSFGLSYTDVSGDLSSFAGLINLQSLYLSGNDISGDLSDLSALTGLTYLDLSSLQIKLPAINFTNTPIPVTVPVKDENGAFIVPDSVAGGSYADGSVTWNIPSDASGTLSYTFSKSVSIGSVTGTYSGTVYQPYTAVPYTVHTVVFKDYDGAILKTETVNHGAAATAPVPPARASYTFTGWSAAFDNITTDLIVTAQYVALPVDRNIVKGRDTYQFINTTSHFFSGGPYTYKITGDYYAHLLNAPGLGGAINYNGEISTWKQYLIDTMNSNWGGSCFGMSAVLALTKAERLNPGFFQPGAQNLYALSYPRSSATVTNLINYYQLMQSTPTTNRTLQYSSDEPTNIKYLVDSMRESSHPVIVSFLIYNDQEHKSLAGGHAVVGYELLETDNDYRIKIWDPNSLESPSNTLTISKDYSFAAFSNTYPHMFIRSAHTVEGNKYDYMNIQQLLSGSSAYSSYNAAGMAPFAAAAAAASDTGATALTVNYGDFEIGLSSGLSATVTNGVKTSGNFDIGDAYPLNEPGSQLVLRFAVPNLPNGETYTVTPSGIDVAEFVTTLFYDDDLDGFYTRIAAAVKGSFIFGAGGIVSAEFAEPSRATLATTHNKAEATLYTTSATAYGTELTLTPTADGKTQVISDAAYADIAMSGDYNEVIFAEVDTADTVFVGESGDSVTLFAENGAVIVTKAVGYTITFYSLGGTPVAAIANITEASVVSSPANPTREGYVFAGWYTDETYTQKWSFASPVTGNTALYAKWDADSGTPSTGPGTGGGGSGSPAQTTEDEAPAKTPVTTPSTGATASISQFSDVRNHWAYDAISFVVSKGLFNGVSDNSFAPDATMTRAMFATVLARYAGGTALGTASFGDIPARQWYSNGVLWAAENGIVNGIGNNLFDPNGSVTREQLAVMLYNYAKSKGLDMSATGDLSAYGDAAGVSDWAKDAMIWAVSTGLITGKPGSLLDAGGTATRAEVAVILQRFDLTQ